MKKKKTYDIGIIGSGVAGVFAALRIANKYKKCKIAMFEFGPPPPTCLRRDPIAIKRRRKQLEGWMGCFSTGDGRLYTDDFKQLSHLVDGRKLRGINNWVFDIFNSIERVKIAKNKHISAHALKNITDLGYEIEAPEYRQWMHVPTQDPFHKLSHYTFEEVEKYKTDFNFDTEVFEFFKDDKMFTVITSNGDFNCKNILLCAGRTGWRWVNEIYEKFGIPITNSHGRYGIRVEVPGQQMKDFNNCPCTFKRGDLVFGPLSWDGSVIQEDHTDMTIASFRSNEKRWNSSKVFFSATKNVEFPKNDAWQQLDRIAKLAFILSNDRIGREKIKSFIKKDSQIALLPEYAFLNDMFKEADKIFPGLISRGYFHLPEIETCGTSIATLNNNLESEVEGLYIAGESAGVKGIVASAISGAVAAEGIFE